MKLVIILGDSAVGKMTVGQELTKITDLRLFHNHMTIEPVVDIFGYYDHVLVEKLRRDIFESFAKSDNYGLIFTLMMDFDRDEDWDYLEKVKNIFRPYDTEFYYVELIASQEVRLKRNATENRLAHKPSKRNIEVSNQRLINDDIKHRCVSKEGEIPFPNYLRIDNTNLSAHDTAVLIKKEFNL